MASCKCVPPVVLLLLDQVFKERPVVELNQKWLLRLQPGRLNVFRFLSLS